METDALKDAFPSWFWTVGIVLAVGCAALIASYYLLHPDRNIWEDFSRRPFIPDDLSGLVDAPPGAGDQDGPGS